ncbi:hypothetical protein IV38_GL000862 [Lactobacillus selangorensis]|uniref:Gram-positive cocci surface proteins LPxTG domain-containing protein n=1 Tax=Lactobacillus selangorensis TaxID=81857 RepID=A0A0R2FJ64_9LACO|nr:LPXTG cell wall anchor domain-containing protein [Lactobacillus selangorensis]KRN28659.1 hypothetical protein IV38_GL000862 [Lactobacillus selangorensis]KRN32931.1 hypothetical protein IV40_GL000991 [Lactobacillus selangorensis]
MKKWLFSLLALLIMAVGLAAHPTRASAVDRNQQSVTVDLEAPKTTPPTDTDGAGRNTAHKNDASGTIQGQLEQVIHGILPQTGEQTSFWLAFLGTLLLVGTVLLILERRRPYESS